MTKLQGDELERVTQNALIMRDTFDFDVTESVKTADTMMKNFGVTSDQAYSLLTQGAQQGLNKSDELLDSANEYSVYFKSLGFSASEMFDVFGAGLEAGAFNLDKVGDAVKEFNIRAKDGSKNTAQAFQALGMDANAMAQTFAKGGPEAKASFDTVVKAIAAVQDPVQRNTIGVQLFGTQFEDMEAGVISAMGTAKSQFDATKNTMDQMNKIRLNSPGQFLSMMGRQIQTNFVIPLGKTAMPLFQKVFDWTTAALPVIQHSVSAAFGEMGKLASWAADKLSFIGDAWAVAKSIFSGGDFNFGAWTGLVDKLTGFGVSGDQATAFAQGFTRSLLKVQSSLEVVTSGAKFLFSLFQGGADLNAWSGMQAALVKLGVSQEGAYQFATKLTAGFLKTRDAIGSAINFIRHNFVTLQPFYSALIGGIGNAIREVVPLVLNISSTFYAVSSKIIAALVPVVSYLYARLAPVLTNIVGFIANNLIPAISGAITAILPKIIMVADKLGQAFTAVWGFIQPVIDNIITGFTVAFPIIQSVVMNAVTAVQGIISGLLTTLGGLLDFITGVFTGNWGQAWGGVKDVFSGIFSALGAVLALPINIAIDAMNAAIRGINGLSFDVPDWVPGIGGKNFGFSISEIPKIGGYADGGIVSSPELAWIGEGGDKEVIVPINNSERSRGLWESAGRMLGTMGNAQGNSGGTAAPIYITHSPTIIVQGGSGDIEGQVARGVRRGNDGLLEQLKSIAQNEVRLSYGT
ncbi:phage tail tape measure protein [Paenibacillus sp. TAB 01]|uniref:phage tail tape measure protein n=1 Tax=Paenibacillus sp. TAB 01 TaxID=3368988 RepID=UPI003752C596